MYWSTNSVPNPTLFGGANLVSIVSPNVSRRTSPVVVTRTALFRSMRKVGVLRVGFQNMAHLNGAIVQGCQYNEIHPDMYYTLQYNVLPVVLMSTPIYNTR
jgi:hypothetical protein